MKGMAGGLIRDGFAAAAWMETQEGVVPIWGVQRESELDEFLQCIREGAALTDERRATIERDRRELSGEFCRGCGYCMPCPAGIEINHCARMSLMLRRAPAGRRRCTKSSSAAAAVTVCRSVPTASTPPSSCRQTTGTTGRSSTPPGRKNQRNKF